MKTLYQYFTKLSLVRQLILLLLAGALLILLIMMPIVDFNLNGIVDSSMYDTLKAEQDSIINNAISVPNRGRRKVSHIIYDTSTHSVTATNVMNNQELQFLYNNVFYEPLNKIENEFTELSVEGKSKTLHETFYYVITKLSDHEYLVSIVNSDYSNELLSDIRNQTIYIIYGFFLFVALILIVWVVSLITPLNKIKKYIDDIKNRNQSELNIARKDEIGIVSMALVEMNEELLRQDKIKEEMIHNISHDLKTPIAIIKTYGESVKDDIYPYGSKDASMDVILENADRLENKVQSLLYLNRLNYINDSEKKYEEVDMKELILKIVSQMDLLNVNIQVETYLDDVIFIGSIEHFRIAIENLLDNARRYASTRIIITLKEDELEIYNDGSSIDEKLLPYLFTPYVKGNKGQFGLGLSIVKKIASMYDYDVVAHNKEDGCSFFIKKHIV